MHGNYGDGLNGVAFGFILLAGIGALIGSVLLYLLYKKKYKAALIVVSACAMLVIAVYLTLILLG